MTEGAKTHPRHRLESTIHSPIRFSIMAALVGVDEAEFRRLRDVLETTDPTLSKQASILEKAGYVRIRKGYLGKRPRTWLRLTTKGRSAFEVQVQALQAIADSRLSDWSEAPETAKPTSSGTGPRPGEESLSGGRPEYARNPPLRSQTFSFWGE